MKSPRAYIEVDGQAIRWTDIVELRVTNTLYMAADTFELTVRNDKLLSDFFRKGQQVKILIGYASNPTLWHRDDLTHIFTGKIDAVEPSFSDPPVCRIIGRDYSAPLLDTYFSASYGGKTASQIAESLFKKYGLTPRVTATEEIVQRDAHERKREWEILQALADLEGFVCYVDKDKIGYFGPRDLSDEEIVETLYFMQEHRSNVGQIDFRDSGIDVWNKVTVRHYKKKVLIEASAENKALIESMGQVKEKIVYSSKAKDKAKAQEIANNLLKEFSRDVITGNAARVIGNPIIGCEKKIKTVGVGRFEGVYYVERVDHHLQAKQGYTMNLDFTSLRPEGAEQYRDDLYENKGDIW